MSTAHAGARRDVGNRSRGDRTAHLKQVIEEAAHLLPAQGPITVFIHHNTLHAFEHLPFEQAVREAARVFGCNPYLAKDWYRDALARGRIRRPDLEAVLRAELGTRADEPIASLCSRFELRLAMSIHPVRSGPASELRWFVAETDALRRVRPEVPPDVRDHMLEETRRWVMHEASSTQRTQPRGDWFDDFLKQFGEPSRERWSDATWEAFMLRALWRQCRDGARRAKLPSVPPTLVRHRDILLDATGHDSDRLVHDVLIRFCAAYLDQGMARWQLPGRERGVFRSFCSLYRLPGGPPDRWLRGLRKELADLQHSGIGPLQSIERSLEQLGVPEGEWSSYLSATLLALPGWAGMIHETEVRGDRIAIPTPRNSLVEFVAIRLLLERYALAFVARETLGFRRPLRELRAFAKRQAGPRSTKMTEQRAFDVFQVVQLLGVSPAKLDRLTDDEWSALVSEVAAFSVIERRRVFHLAFERRLRVKALDAVSIRAASGHRKPVAPRLQAIFCLDEREESFRRHLEELLPDVETFGTAGFFSVPMYYRGAADAHFTPLCPIAVRPKNWVAEDVIEGWEDEHRRRARFRGVVGRTLHRFHIGSRTASGGTVLAASVGVLASIPLVARVLFPRLTARFRRTAGRLLRPPLLTRLRIERTAEEPGTSESQLGFTLDEMADMTERLLRDIGLTSHFARLVLVIGHGSSSLNNPHKSAYDCGACGGSAGGPNARAVSRMLNDPRVRGLLRKRGVDIPDETVFVGGMHDTCSDSVSFSDVGRLPASHHAEFVEVRRLIRQCCERNAHERCRRFQSASLTLDPHEARLHVEARSEDLAQPRPELGHATNAICLVGRRSRSRGLFADRRAFLASYDPTQDDAESTILGRILEAAFPVCAGINLEYFFSRVDPTGFGSGTKLPHNVTSLLGVMDGTASDLRTGLPWQMVEIHEPVRLLFVVETHPETMLRLMDRHQVVGRLCRNEWVQLATLDPDSPAIHVFEEGRFRLHHPESTELPIAKGSVDWYGGWRDHLDFALIAS